MTAGERLAQKIGVCTRCAGQPAATATGHAPRPFVRFRPKARVLIARQTPGARFRSAGGHRRCRHTALPGAGGRDRDRAAVAPMAARALRQAARAAGERRR
ncbi:MAG: hypothetical protein IOC92_01810 [Rhodobacter sp.]|nr:hypothetical protein [Rhodobacter sp.]MCA3463068.1 hypothetical protein [Rhodobacter sp.]MCA3467460.1 hypothetical protein [Rhodobacter sp.]MCA3471520.1 hypothetical protein [Rhodobacter sp.]MCA3475284.1 hypothetical protein [Rhodobacter sp.]